MKYPIHRKINTVFHTRSAFKKRLPSSDPRPEIWFWQNFEYVAMVTIIVWWMGRHEEFYNRLLYTGRILYYSNNCIWYVSFECLGSTVLRIWCYHQFEYVLFLSFESSCTIIFVCELKKILKNIFSSMQRCYFKCKEHDFVVFFSFPLSAGWLL
jgi:hypothetical protein